MAGMLPLALSIIASTLFSLTIKFAHRRGCTLLAVGATNYLTAAVVYLGASLLTFVRLGSRLPAPRTLLMGGVTGVLFVGAFVLIAELQERRGISVTTAALRLSVLFPVVASLLFWGEKASGTQLAGMGVTLVSLPLLGMARGSGSGSRAGRRRWSASDYVGLVVTVGLFIANGLVSVAIRFYHQVGSPEERVYFFAVLFLTAALASRLALAAARHRVARLDVLPGVFLGIWNTGASFLLLVSLATIPGFIAFPLQSALALVLTAAAALVVWREKLSVPAAIGMVLAVGAVVLLNL